MTKKAERIEYGEYIVADPRICHGALTFKGTRIFVRAVLDMVAEEMDWDEIIAQWRGSITKEAIAEAVRLGKEALLEKAERNHVEYGEYLVADPRICHGALTFKGTRIFVRQALDMVAEGMNWDKIVWNFHGFIGKEAIAEALQLAKDALLKKAGSNSRRKSKP